MSVVKRQKFEAVASERAALTPVAWGAWLPAAPLLLVLAWSYGPSLFDLSQRWWSEPDYNHCFFVPVFSGYLLWSRRHLCPVFDSKPGRAAMIAGVLLIISAGALRWAAAYYQTVLLEPFSLLPCVAGIALVLGGWSSLLWSWPAILFLGFMVPLPGFVAGALGQQLQRVATISSTYVLQTVGIPAVSVGNVIRLSHGEIGVVEACSGLRMLNLFFAITLGATFLVARPLWEKLVILASAAVIGVITNVIRISTTGMAQEWIGPELADRIFHDLAGWLMMPLAMGLLWFELWLLSGILVPRVSNPSLMLQRNLADAPRR